jgi:hypothetical protein
MATYQAARLADRGVVGVTGPDAAKLLQGVTTSDIEGMAAGEARLGGLLTPQGKILFEFLIVATAGGFLLDVARDRAGDLAKRLMMYRLRAKAEIADRSADLAVLAAPDAPTAAPPAQDYRDPRSAALGWRLITPAAEAAATAGDGGLDARRVAAGIAEGGRDYAFADAFPHEANWDLTGGVSFTKGCYVGQEVVARMQNKAVVRKRVVRIAGRGLASGAEVRVGEAMIGTVGTVAGEAGLALLRLDRVAEALDKGLALTVAGAAVTVDPDAVAGYRRALAERPQAPDLPS